MWTYHRNGLFPKKKKKEDKEAVRLPAINNRQTSLFQRTNKKSYDSKGIEKAESSITSMVQLHQTYETPDDPFLEDRTTKKLHHGNFFKVKTVKALLDLHEYGRKTEDSPKLLRSMEALMGGDEEEKSKRKDNDCINKEGRETDSRLANSDKNTDKKSEDNKLPMPYMLCGPMTSEVQRKKEPPFPLKEKRFMIYICGGYKDTVAERSALMDNVYPRLYLYCKQRGYDFRMVDLRRGVGNPVTEHHDTIELHVENLQQCQETQGPNFILFVGQKYEVRSLPPTITRDAFEALVRVVERDRQQMSKNKAVEDFSASGSMSSITTGSSTSSFTQESIYRNNVGFGEQATNSGLLSQSSHNSFSDSDEARLSPVAARSVGDLDKDLTLLQMWYKLDENCLPPVYRLLPISTHHPNILSMDRQLRKQAMKDWIATCNRLWGVLQCIAVKALGQEEASLLLRTVLDWEVETALQYVNEAPPEEHCHCYKRFIPDLHFNLKSQYANLYADLLKGGAQLDPVLSTAHQSFMGRLHEKLRHTNIYERNVGWGQKGLNPKHNRKHQFYTERITSHIQRTVINSLKKVMKATKAPGPFNMVRKEAARVQIQEEIQRHINYARHMGKGCTLRQLFLADMKRAMEQSTTKTILLLGPPGWGKSTTMAAVAELAPSWLPGSVNVLVHFIGLTGESRNIRLVLQSLCVQLAEAYCPHTQLSEGFPEMINEFYSLLSLVGAERPLVVLLDGLDELSEECGPDLSWISTPLPPNVHLILSATTDSPCAQTLQQSAHTIVLSLPPLSLDDIMPALEAKLWADRRRLQEQQWQLLVQACLSCPCPLYLEAAYSESLLWTSFSSQVSLSLPATLKGLYLGLLARLERNLGNQLVRRAASLISISRWGVTEEELLDLLAKDGKVLQELTSTHPSSSSHRRVPYVLWARMKRDLGHHLTEVRTDGTWVYRWTHSELSRVCIDLYLSTSDSLVAVHADYADYYREKSQYAHIFQPLAWTLDNEDDSGQMAKSYRFNLRKLNGLPFHLVQSGQILPFLSECIFNYEFLLHKAWGLSVLDIEEDLKKAVLPDK